MRQASTSIEVNVLQLGLASFPSVNFPGRQAEWQHVTTAECSAGKMSPFYVLTKWEKKENFSVYYSSLYCTLSPFWLLFILSQCICLFQSRLYCHLLLFSHPPYVVYSIKLHVFAVTFVEKKKNTLGFVSLFLLLASSVTSPCLLILPFWILSLLFLEKVMEVCFYRKWQSKELCKGCSGFLFDTAKLPSTHTHTLDFTPLGTWLKEFFMLIVIRHDQGPL